MTIDTAALRQLCEKATSGPWEAILWPNGEWEMRAKDGPLDTAFGNVCSTAIPSKPGREEESFANASLYHAARTALPELLDRVEKLEWLIEVQAWKPRGPHGRCMGTKDWYEQKTWPDRRDSYSRILANALRDAGYGGVNNG